MPATAGDFPYAKCKSCKRDQLAFSLTDGECYYCRGDIVFNTEHDPECKHEGCKEVNRDEAG